MSEQITLRNIVAEWLNARRYDGLVSDDAECGCEIGDLFPCDGPCDTCRPAYRGPDPSGSSEADWLMYASKVAAEAARTVAEQK